MTDAFDWHGGRLDEARERFGNGNLPWLDLSTGINPRAWPVPENIGIDWQALPTPSALATLEQAAARHFGVDPALCCALPGSEIGLRVLGRLLDLPGRHMAPCYRTHTAAFRNSHTGDPARCEGRSDAVVIANPNNPDGRILKRAELQRWLSAQQAAGGWLIVDEAFADAVPETSIAGLVGAGRNMIVLRSFGKFFGLAGVRLGFAIAPPPIVGGLREMLGDWPVSAAAIAIGTRAYADTVWIAKARTELPVRERAFDDLLHRHGLVVKGGTCLFRLIENERAGALFERFGRNRILTRPFADYPHWLRLGVPADRNDLARIEAAFADG